MTRFQDAPDENIEHDENMELRSSNCFILLFKSTILVAFNILLLLFDLDFTSKLFCATKKRL